MKKILILAISLIGTLALTACGVTNVRVGGGCEGGSESPIRCSVGAMGSFKSGSGDGIFDASLASIDLSSSSVSVTSNSGTLVISVKNSSGATVASSVFNWYAAGDVLYPSNPEQMSNWVNANVSDGYDVIYDVDNIETTGKNGNNTFTAIFRYGYNSVGATSGFYLNNADLNGF